MKLDVLGQAILQDIQKYDGFEQAIIAGGFCRDQVMGGKFKDIDIFVPALSFAQISAFLEKLPDDWSLISQRPISKVKRGYSLVEHISDIIDFKYLDAIDIQVMNTQIKAQEGFGLKVVEGFNYGIDQVWAEKDEVLQHPNFVDDKHRGRATLVDRSVDIYSLPHHMKKYFRLSEKYPNLDFACPFIKFEGLPVGEFKPKVFSENVQAEFRVVGAGGGGGVHRERELDNWVEVRPMGRGEEVAPRADDAWNARRNFRMQDAERWQEMFRNFQQDRVRFLEEVPAEGGHRHEPGVRLPEVRMLPNGDLERIRD